MTAARVSYESRSPGKHVATKQLLDQNGARAAPAKLGQGPRARAELACSSPASEPSGTWRPQGRFLMAIRACWCTLRFIIKPVYPYVVLCEDRKMSVFLSPTIRGRPPSQTRSFCYSAWWVVKINHGQSGKCSLE